MEILEYKSDIPGTLYPFIRRKTKLNPDEVEAFFTALVTNEQYINFNPELSEKAIQLHEQYVNQTPNVITEKRAVTSAKSRHTRASNALAIKPDDDAAKKKQLKASADLISSKKNFVKSSNELLDVFNNLNQTLTEIIESYNKANPDNQFIKADIKQILKGIVKYENPEAIKANTNPNTSLILYVDPENGIVDNSSNKPSQDINNENAIVSEEITIEKGEITLDDKDVEPNAENTIPNSSDSQILPANNETVVINEDDGNNENNATILKKDDPNDLKNDEPQTNTSSQQQNNVANQSEQPNNQTKDKKEEKKEDKKEETKKEEKKPDIKEAAYFTGTISFLVAVFSIALLIAGVGVAGWFLPTLAVASSLTSAIANTSATFKYVEKQPKNDIKTFKIKEKNKKNKKDNVNNKNKDKKSEQEMIQQNEISPVQSDVTEYKDTHQAESVVLNEDYSEQKTLRIVTQEQKDMLKQAVDNVSKTKGTENYAAAIEEMANVIVNVTPENLSVNDYREQDRDIAQACIDYSISYATYMEVNAEDKVATNQLDDAIRAYTDKPKNKKAARQYEIATEHKEYQDNLVEKLLSNLEESLSAIEKLLNGRPEEENTDLKEKEIDEVINDTSEVSTADIEKVYHDNYRAEVSQLIVKLEKIFKDKENVLNNYPTIVDSCDKIIAIVNHIEKPTTEELKIATLCKNLKAHEANKNDLFMQYEKECKVLENLTKSGASAEAINKQEKTIEDIKEQGFECSRGLTQTIKELYVNATSTTTGLENALNDGQEK